MCLILTRQPNFEIPYAKFETAILNNPDGYGLCYPGDKGLEVLRTPVEPDPEKLYRLINEELKEKDLMVHLRYTTVGATNLRNAHPFPILEKATDGIDLRMAHNGTLGKFKTMAGKGESDTRAFVRKYVRPLFKRLARGMEPEELLADPFLKQLLEDQLTAASVLTFMDSEGNSLICNEEGNGGKKEPEWYYSNTYSFNKSHRVAPSSKGSSVSYPSQQSGTTTPVGFAKDCKQPLFTKKHNLPHIRDTYKLTDTTIESLVVNDKKDAELLIKELIFNCQQLDNIASRLEKENIKLKKGTSQ